MRICFEGVDLDFETESRIEDQRSSVGDEGLEVVAISKLELTTFAARWKER